MTQANRSRRSCVRYPLLPGSYTHSATQGMNSLPFSGRVGSRRLKPGTYRLHASPRTASGRGTPRRKTFRIIRRR